MARVLKRIRRPTATRKIPATSRPVASAAVRRRPPLHGACRRPAVSSRVRALSRTLAVSGLLFLLPAVETGQARAATFDAIVIDDDTGGAGGNGDYAVGQASTAKEAQRIAMSNCVVGGNVACTLKLTYQRCGAYASNGRASGKGTADGMDQAVAAALASCGDKTCRLVVADCVDRPLRPPPR